MKEDFFKYRAYTPTTPTEKYSEALQTQANKLAIFCYLLVKVSMGILYALAVYQQNKNKINEFTQACTCEGPRGFLTLNNSSLIPSCELPLSMVLKEL